MTRKQALAYARIAGYHADTASYIRLIVECRVNRTAMNAAWISGEAAKRAGVPCGCYQCKTADEQAQALGHKDADAGRKHDAWLDQNGSPEFKKWKADIRADAAPATA